MVKIWLQFRGKLWDKIVSSGTSTNSWPEERCNSAILKTYDLTRNFLRDSNQALQMPHPNSISEILIN